MDLLSYGSIRGYIIYLKIDTYLKLDFNENCMKLDIYMIL